MANDLRVRQLDIGGLVEDNPLTSGATLLTSAGLASITGGVDSSHHVAIVLDPDGVDGAPEIAYVANLTVGAGATGSTGLLRGQEGTTARQHNRDTPWVHATTAADYQDRSLEPAQRKPYLPSTLNDEFDDDSIASAWVRVDRSGNASGVTWQENGDFLAALLQGTDNASEIHGLLRPMTGLTAPPVTIETAIRYVNPYNTNYNMMGLVFADGTTYGSGKQMWAMPYTNTDGVVAVTASMRTFTGFNSDIASINQVTQFMSPVMYFRMVWSAANTFQLWESPDGVNWRQVLTDMSYTMTPTYFGFGVGTWGHNTPGIISFDYFRVS